MSVLTILAIITTLLLVVLAYLIFKISAKAEKGHARDLQEPCAPINYPRLKSRVSLQIIMKKTLDYVDLGLPSGVLWASKNATVEDKSMPHDAGEKSLYCQHLFDYDEAKRFFEALLPNPAEFQELYDLCEWKWLKRKRAYKVTGPNGNSILLQAEGLAYKGVGFNCDTKGWEGFYWSSKNCEANAYCLVFNDVDYNPQWNEDKTKSFSVRLVKRTNHK